MARAHLCDVPGCGQSRKRWQRLCDRCFRALPGDIRTDLAAHHQAGRKAEWRADRRLAGQFMAPLLMAAARPTFAGRRSAPTPQQAYAAQQKLLGEHD